jgi:hypothetical protein
MIRPGNQKRSDDPLARFRPGWRTRARNARGTWLPGTGAIETAIEDGFREGVKFSSEILEEDGQRELAVRIRARTQRQG